MKRLIGTLLCLVLFITMGTAVAEKGTKDVTLIAGLQFGMTFEEAQKVSGYDAKEMKSYHIADYAEFGIVNSHYLQGKGTIGGYSATVKVFFDADNKLVQVFYGIGAESFDGLPESVEDSDVLKSEYAAVEENLQNIYGDTTDRKYPVTTRHGFHQMNASILVFNYSDYDYSARMIPQSDGNSVLIEHVRSLRFHYNGQTIGHVMSYTFYDGDYSQAPSGNDSVGF